MTRPTLHLVPEARWDAWDPATPYLPAAYEADGFVHCTDGDEEMLKTANRFYRADPQPFLLLTVDLDSTGSPWRFDDPGSPLPAHLRADLARGDHRGPPLRPRSGRDVHRHRAALTAGPGRPLLSEDAARDARGDGPDPPFPGRGLGRVASLR